MNLGRLLICCGLVLIVLGVIVSALSEPRCRWDVCPEISNGAGRTPHSTSR